MQNQYLKPLGKLVTLVLLFIHWPITNSSLVRPNAHQLDFGYCKMLNNIMPNNRSDNPALNNWMAWISLQPNIKMCRIETKQKFSSTVLPLPTDGWVDDKRYYRTRAAADSPLRRIKRKISSTNKIKNTTNELNEANGELYKLCYIFKLFNRPMQMIWSLCQPFQVENFGIASRLCAIYSTNVYFSASEYCLTIIRSKYLSILLLYSFLLLLFVWF